MIDSLGGGNYQIYRPRGGAKQGKWGVVTIRFTGLVGIRSRVNGEG